MWVKICGIRDAVAARQVADLAPDAIGLNFYEPSPRYVRPAEAAAIVAALPAHIEPVGVFVNHAPEVVRRICQDCGLRTAQLHGDEPPEFLAQLGGLNLVRVYRVNEADLLRGDANGPSRLDAVAADLQRCAQLGVALRACLVEARVAGAYGGTGHAPPWDLLRAAWQPAWPPLILAGGLHPGNVTDAIRRTRPWGVDVASGVERVRGIKDLGLVAEFVARSRAVS